MGTIKSVVVHRDDISSIEAWAASIPSWSDLEETPLAVREAVREDVYTDEEAIPEEGEQASEPELFMDEA